MYLIEKICTYIVWLCKFIGFIPDIVGAEFKYNISENSIAKLDLTFNRPIKLKGCYLVACDYSKIEGEIACKNETTLVDYVIEFKINKLKLDTTYAVKFKRKGLLTAFSKNFVLRRGVVIPQLYVS